MRKSISEFFDDRLSKGSFDFAIADGDKVRLVTVNEVVYHLFDDLPQEMVSDVFLWKSEFQTKALKYVHGHIPSNLFYCECPGLSCFTGRLVFICKDLKTKEKIERWLLANLAPEKQRGPDSNDVGRCLPRLLQKLLKINGRNGNRNECREWLERVMS